MGLNDVKQDILNDAKATADEIISEAKAEKERILEDAEKRAEEIVEQAEAKAQNEADALRKKEISSARMKAKKMRLNAQQAVLDTTFDEFRDAVMELSEDEEADLIKSALEELSDDIEIGTVHVAPDHTDTASDYGDVEQDEDIRGLVIESADGARRFDLRFEKIAEQVARENRKHVSEVLFE